MGDPAAAGGGRVRHDGDGRVLEEVGQPILTDVAGKFDVRISLTLLFHRLYVARGLGMVPSSDYESGVRQGLRYMLECLNHQFQALVSSPFAEGEYAVLGIPPAG